MSCRYKNCFIFRKIITCLLIAAFGVSMVVPPSVGLAADGLGTSSDVASSVGQTLPAPGSLVALSGAFQPPVLLGLKIHPENPLLFDFIIDQGSSQLSDEELTVQTERLIKYFLAALTIPEKEVWVNLSPDEKDRIIPDLLGQTEMGKQMLEQDYLLKQLSASLTNPDTQLGKAYWQEVSNRGSLGPQRDSPLSDFTKIWIKPHSAEVLESNGIVLVGAKRLQVMMQEGPQQGGLPPGGLSSSVHKDVAMESFRSLILPKIEQEVNEGRNFAAVRQIYNSVILAAWYKKALRASLLGQIYADKGKVAGVQTDEIDFKEQVYRRYLDALKQGVYNLIREEEDPVTGDIIPRKYFSGGAEFAASSVVDVRQVPSAALAGQLQDNPRLMVVSTAVREGRGPQDAGAFSVDIDITPAGESMWGADAVIKTFFLELQRLYKPGTDQAGKPMTLDFSSGYSRGAFSRIYSLFQDEEGPRSSQRLNQILESMGFSHAGLRWTSQETFAELIRRLEQEGYIRVTSDINAKDIAQMAMRELLGDEKIPSELLVGKVRQYFKDIILPEFKDRTLSQLSEEQWQALRLRFSAVFYISRVNAFTPAEQVAHSDSQRQVAQIFEKDRRDLSAQDWQALVFSMEETKRMLDQPYQSYSLQTWNIVKGVAFRFFVDHLFEMAKRPGYEYWEGFLDRQANNVRDIKVTAPIRQMVDRIRRSVSSSDVIETGNAADTPKAFDQAGWEVDEIAWTQGPEQIAFLENSRGSWVKVLQGKIGPQDVTVYEIYPDNALGPRFPDRRMILPGLKPAENFNEAVSLFNPRVVKTPDGEMTSQYLGVDPKSGEEKTGHYLQVVLDDKQILERRFELAGNTADWDMDAVLNRGTATPAGQAVSTSVIARVAQELTATDFAQVNRRATELDRRTAAGRRSPGRDPRHATTPNAQTLERRVAERRQTEDRRVKTGFSLEERVENFLKLYHTLRAPLNERDVRGIGFRRKVWLSIHAMISGELKDIRLSNLTKAPSSSEDEFTDEQYAMIHYALDMEKIWDVVGAQLKAQGLDPLVALQPAFFFLLLDQIKHSSLWGIKKTYAAHSSVMIDAEVESFKVLAGNSIIDVHKGKSLLGRRQLEIIIQTSTQDGFVKKTESITMGKNSVLDNGHQPLRVTYQDNGAVKIALADTRGVQRSLGDTRADILKIIRHRDGSVETAMNIDETVLWVNILEAAPVGQEQIEAWRPQGAKYQSLVRDAAQQLKDEGLKIKISDGLFSSGTPQPYEVFLRAFLVSQGLGGITGKVFSFRQFVLDVQEQIEQEQAELQRKKSISDTQPPAADIAVLTTQPAAPVQATASDPDATVPISIPAKVRVTARQPLKIGGTVDGKVRVGGTDKGYFAGRLIVRAGDADYQFNQDSAGHMSISAADRVLAPQLELGRKYTVARSPRPGMPQSDILYDSQNKGLSSPSFSIVIQETAFETVTGARIFEFEITDEKSMNGLVLGGAVDISASSPAGQEHHERASAAVVSPDTVGGIDFDTSDLELQIKRDNNGVPLPLPQQNLQQIDLDGLYPVILNIVPVNTQTLPLFLGQSFAPSDSSQLSSSRLQ